MENYFIDTHSHIDMIEDISLDEIIKSANEVNVKKIIMPAVNEQDFESKIEICNNHENIFCMLGVFPEEAKTWDDKTYEKIINLAKNNKKGAVFRS